MLSYAYNWWDLYCRATTGSVPPTPQIQGLVLVWCSAFCASSWCGLFWVPCLLPFVLLGFCVLVIFVLRRVLFFFNPYHCFFMFQLRRGVACFGFRGHRGVGCSGLHLLFFLVLKVLISLY